MHTPDTTTPDTTIQPESIAPEEVLAVLSCTMWLTHTQILQAISNKKTEQGESAIPDQWKYRHRIKDILSQLSLKGTVSAVNITQLKASPNYDPKAVKAERDRLNGLIEKAQKAMREVDFTKNSFNLYRLRNGS